MCFDTVFFSCEHTAFTIIFFTCALCPGQRLLVVPGENAAMVLWSRIQLHVAGQLKKKKKIVVVISYWCEFYQEFYLFSNLCHADRLATTQYVYMQSLIGLSS